MTGRRPWRRAMKRIACGVLAVIALLVALAAPAPWLIRGARFGTVVGWMLPATRGKITVGGGRWSWGGGLGAAARAAGRAGARRPARRRPGRDRGAARGARHRRRRDGARRRAASCCTTCASATACGASRPCARERGVGFLAALPVPAPGGDRARAHAGAGQPVRDPRRRARRHRHHLRLPGWGLSVARVHAHGNLALASTPAAAGADAHGRPARPPVSFTFDVSDADLGGGGVLRILDGRARDRAAVLARAASNASRPPATRPMTCSSTPTTSPPARRGCRSHGAFTGIYGVSSPAHGAGDRSARAPRPRGRRRARRSSRAARPRCRSRVGAAERRLPARVRRPLRPHAGSPRRRAASTSAGATSTFAASASMSSVEPAAARARVSGLTFASPDGGRLTARRRPRPPAGARRARARSLRHRALPAGRSCARWRAACSTGGCAAQSTSSAAAGSLDELALTLARPAGSGGPRRLRLTSARGATLAAARGTETVRIAGARYAGGTLTLPELGGAFAGGQVRARASITLADAAGHLQPPVLDVDAQRARHFGHGSGRPQLRQRHAQLPRPRARHARRPRR